MKTEKRGVHASAVCVLMLVLSAGFAGCASQRVTYLADGRKGYSISCSRLYQDWSSCMVRAGRLCRNKGYTVAYSDEVDRQLIIGCKEPIPVSAQAAQ